MNEMPNGSHKWCDGTNKLRGHCVYFSHDVHQGGYCLGVKEVSILSPYYCLEFQYPHI